MEIVHVYQRKRREFGRQCNFSDRNAKLVVDIDPDDSLRQQYVYKDPCDEAVQVTQEFSEHDVNTERIEYQDAGVNHTEGGWPKDVDPNENEQTTRYRKKAEKEEVYQATVTSLAEAMEDVIKQNLTIDIYEEYFPERSELASVEPPSARTINVLRDPKQPARSAVSLSWCSDGSPRLAVAYAITDFQGAEAGTSFDSHVWNIDRPTEPDVTLTSSSPIVSVAYNPKDAHIIVGGLYNGQVALWDTRKGAAPTVTTPVEHSHRDPAFSALFLNSKSGTEFFSCSSDGKVIWWDSRKVSEPTDVLQLDLGGDGALAGAVSMDYEPTMPTRLMVGTEQGLVVNINRKGKTEADKLSTTYDAHHGPVYTVKRHPTLPKYFLTVGDWCSRIWAEDIKESSMLASAYLPCRATTGTWSTSRAGVFFIGRADGMVDVWDLTHKLDTPVLSLRVSDSPVRALAVNNDGRLLACGDKQGSITLIELNDTLAVSQKNEKAFMSALFEKETSREKALASRIRELTLQERARSVKASKASMHSEAAAAVEADDEEDPIDVAEKAFWQAIEPEKVDDKPAQDKENVQQEA